MYPQEVVACWNICAIIVEKEKKTVVLLNNYYAAKGYRFYKTELSNDIKLCKMYVSTKETSKMFKIIKFYYNQKL